jgi:hypothetical protein
MDEGVKSYEELGDGERRQLLQEASVVYGRSSDELQQALDERCASGAGGRSGLVVAPLADAA